MEKEEFLRTLGGALSGEVPQHIIQENLRYYDNYISDEMRKGRTEADIIEELGGPRIIAKTIIDAAEAGTLLNETERRAGRDGVGDEEIASIIDDLASEGFFKRVGELLVS